MMSSKYENLNNPPTSSSSSSSGGGSGSGNSRSGRSVSGSSSNSNRNVRGVSGSSSTSTSSHSKNHKGTFALPSDSNNTNNNNNNKASEGHKRSFFSKAWNGELGFKFYWTFYYCAAAVICAACISMVEPSLPTIDILFQAVCISTTAALTTVEMNQLRTGCFVIMAVFGMLGCVFFMLLPTVMYRRHCFKAIDSRIQIARKRGLILPFNRLPLRDKLQIEEYHLLFKSLTLLQKILVVYMCLSLSIGILLIYGALFLHPNLPELEARGYTRFDNAMMLGISGFANTGLCLMSDSIMSLSNNPLAYTIISILILLGNTGIPVALRFMINKMLQIEEYRFKRRASVVNDINSGNAGELPTEEETIASVKYRQTLQYILDNPRKHTTHLFSSTETILLGRSVIGLILIQYVFYLGSTLNRSRALANNSIFELAGIGYFQTLSTRAAGFTIVDLRTLNPGLIVVYAFMMYVAATPFVSALHETTITKSAMFKRFDGEFLEENERWIALQKQKVGKLIESPLKILKNPMQLLQPLSGQEHDTDDVQYSVVDDNPLQHDQVNERGEPIQTMTASRKMRVESVSGPSGFTAFQHPPPPNGQKPTFAKKFLLRHTFFVLSCIVILAFSEDKILSNPKFECNMWYIIFEVIAAYGGPGLSMGVPGKWYSLSGEFTITGKCVIMFLMFLGIHRGLPNKDDEVVDFKFVQYKLSHGFHDDMVPVDDPELDVGLFGRRRVQELDEAVSKSRSNSTVSGGPSRTSSGVSVGKSRGGSGVSIGKNRSNSVVSHGMGIEMLEGSCSKCNSRVDLHQLNLEQQQLQQQQQLSMVDTKNDSSTVVTFSGLGDVEEAMEEVEDDDGNGGGGGGFYNEESGDIVGVSINRRSGVGDAVARLGASGGRVGGVIVKDGQADRPYRRAYSH